LQNPLDRREHLGRKGGVGLGFLGDRDRQGLEVFVFNADHVAIAQIRQQMR